MTLIELGALASALIAIMTLITKLFHLIRALYELISQLKHLSQRVDQVYGMHDQLRKFVNDQANRLAQLEQGGRKYVLV